MFRVLTGINDDQLLGKLLELTNPSMADIRKKIAEFETSKASKKSVSAPKVNDSKARQVKNSQGQEKQATPQSLKGKCTRCGSGAHRKEQCRHAESKCNKCGKIGHLHRVCLRAYNKKRSRRREPARFLENERSQETEDDDHSETVNMIRRIRSGKKAKT